MRTKVFFLIVVMLLCRGVAYAHNPPAGVPILRVEGTGQNIPPPHVLPPPLPTRVFFHVGEIADIPYLMFRLIVWECDNPSEGIEQGESYVPEPMIILRIKGIVAGRHQVNMKWYDPLNPGWSPLGRQTIQIIIQPWPWQLTDRQS